MAIYAISDLHLSFGNNKPMDIFGANWENHYLKIAKDWNEKVKEEDLVILAGDFSWATYISNTVEDFSFLNSLKGKKILLKGNHDYWWETVNKMKNFLKDNNFDNIEFLFNNCIEYNGISICGTRGWARSNDPQYDNDKIFAREYLRLEYSLSQAKTEEKIVVLHFPPNEQIVQIMKKYNVKTCIYGHLHGNSSENVFDGAKKGNIDGIEYYLTSCDYLNFELVKIEV